LHLAFEPMVKWVHWCLDDAVAALGKEGLCRGGADGFEGKGL
jgi:hypothetical protein